MIEVNRKGGRKRLCEYGDRNHPGHLFVYGVLNEDGQESKVAQMVVCDHHAVELAEALIKAAHTLKARGLEAKPGYMLVPCRRCETWQSAIPHCEGFEEVPIDRDTGQWEGGR